MRHAAGRCVSRRNRTQSKNITGVPDGTPRRSPTSAGGTQIETRSCSLPISMPFHGARAPTRAGISLLPAKRGYNADGSVMSATMKLRPLCCRTRRMRYTLSPARNRNRAYSTSSGVPSLIACDVTSPARLSPSVVRSLRKRQANSSDAGSLTNVPRPGRRVMNLWVSSSCKAFRTVPELTPISRAKSASFGIAEPLLHSPVAMRSTNASRTCK